ncbi:glutamyl-tRNA synthetase [Coniophora puteana RWD-64-598 SS2]|uniref:Glutamate--tRNA ligase, mitochondrial n=1 Tax=Coniophora puteana (strain RWD-64-598) TaxID=741705 RepID=A0A5M3N3V5_CONPW|nr:glutamyl-tRNA synthetase [Coniophora puteana RWD-64-598 SS2]EIW86053.1 glutamyl-tRNA synthetase [Coniophora puteana RWD-64-598 SS2]
MTAPVLLRFAPSPTGALHLGGLRTALYNHLYARKLGGKWILRIEDTDATRYVPGSVDGIQQALSWAGLDYDFGPERHGSHGPYFQSERLDLYHTHTRKLLDSGHAYRCFCSPDKLSSTRERLARTGSNATYDKACLHLTEEEVARKVKSGEKHIVRLNDDNLPSRPPAHDIVFTHLRDAHASLPTDPVLLKSDLFPTYHLASVVDDNAMGITHVLRGEEWLPSLPLHLDLYAALKLEPPKFAHLPILLNPDGSKMSKRKGDVRVEEFIRRGWEPEAVLNWLALAGWGTAHESASGSGSEAGTESDSSSSTNIADAAPESTRTMTLPELIDSFDLTHLTHRRNVLDPSKLSYLNKHHLMRFWRSSAPSDPSGPLMQHAHSLVPAVRDAFPGVMRDFADAPYIAKVIGALQGRITNLQDVPGLAPFFFVEPEYESTEAKGMLKSINGEVYDNIVAQAASSVSALSEDVSPREVADALHKQLDQMGVKPKAYMTVLRHALSGMKTGPSVPEIVCVLGIERAATRLERAQGLADEA